MKHLAPLGLACAFALSSQSFGASLFAPGDIIFGGRLDIDTGTFLVGSELGTNSTDPNVYTDNFWPTAEAPFHAIDGVAAKYLNFAELNTGFIVTPSFGVSEGGTVATSITIWTANDSESRDPSSFKLFGTNEVLLAGSSSFDLSNFTLIAEDVLSLPTGRSGTGAAALDPSRSQTVTFTNTAAYTSYLVLFPTVKNEAGANNSMQVAEVQLDGTAVPEPSTVGLLGLTMAGVMAWRRHR